MKNKFKKILSVLLIILSVVLMFGCSKKDVTSEVSTNENASASESESKSDKESKTSSAITTAAASPATASSRTTTQPTTKKADGKTPAVKTTVPNTEKKAQTVTQKPDVRNVCTISIDCETILNNKDKLSENALKFVPSTGTILPTTEYFIENENTTVFDVLKKVCRDNNIHLEFSYTPAYHSSYIEGIANLYERDCGSLSGWMYSVNGEYPNVGCSEVTVKNGDVIRWRYTCDLGWDVGAGDLNQ